MTAESTPAVRLGRPASDYAALMSEVKSAGLLQRSGLGYLPRALLLVAMFSGGVAVFLVVGDSWWQLAVAAYFAVVWAQLGFLGHDAGHQQIFRRRRWNDRTGLVLSNLGIGLSYGWWVDKHNRHHRHPNEVGEDPDVQRNVLAWTSDQADRQRGPIRYIARHQAAFFFPLLVFEGWSLHVASVRTLAVRRRGWRLEGSLLLLHIAIAVTALLLVLSPVKALVFVAVQQSLFGVYLGCSFAPNHKGMPMVSPGQQLDFLRRQVLTSRNVSGGPAVAVLLGGLNYQIEHHLFPCMPSRNLRRCRPIVQRYCLDHGIAYRESSLFGSYGQTLRYLGGVRPSVN